MIHRSDSAPVRVRFAPSPTGFLHLGNARSALLNWLFAARHGGAFVLRIDDTDRERSELRYLEAIQQDLRWLGLTWAEQVQQSDRFDRYAAAAERLRAAGSLYPCYETEEELDLKRKLARARGKPPIYDRAALALTAEERARLEGEGRRPHWRFKLGSGPVSWTDLVRGPTSFAADSLSDPIMVRGDGVPLYGLATIIDDIELGITHIIRGEDHVTNSAAQIQLFRALGGPVPAFAHHSLVTNASGEKFSKRQGALSLGTLRQEGFEAMTIASLLAKLGTSDPVEPRRDLAALAAEFDLAKLSRAQPKLDIAELEALNGRLLHLTPFEDVADRLPPGAGPDFWEAVRPNLTLLGEAKDWWQVCEGPLSPVVTDAAFAAEAARRLPAEPFDGETWKRWTGDLKQATGRGGRMLFLPLRQALTARDHGPEMQKLLPLIGRDRAVSRLMGDAA